VSYRWKPTANCWKPLGYMSLVLLVALAGCNRGGDGTQTPAAAIGGSGKNTPASDASQGPSLKKPASDPLHPEVLIETTAGSVTVRLDNEKAQITVGNFLSYVDAGHYDNTIVHQVYKGQGILAGGYGTNLAEKPVRTPIFNEARNGVKNRRGTISMVRLPDAKDSATSQFFINVADNPALDHKDETPEGFGYCVFGEVKEGGMDVVDRIANTQVHDTPEFERTPTQPIVVKSIRRTR
jgi:cyclophilin family peptidyl-prolyl cis-trans isomerase